MPELSNCYITIHDTRLFVCVFIFVHNKQFSENKIKSKFSSSDPRSDPYLPSPKTTTVVSGLFVQKYVTCIQMNVYKWKHTNTYFFPLLFSRDSIPCMPSQPPSLFYYHIILFISFIALKIYTCWHSDLLSFFLKKEKFA